MFRSAKSMSLANLWVLLGLGIAGIILLSRRRKKNACKDFGAFIQYFELLPPPQPAPPIAPHPLSNLTFAVKDVFDVEGYVTGFGNPDWARTHEPATQTATVVKLLVQGGATCIGKTHMDDLAYSINGVNKHYGIPINPVATSHVAGGSSSGSAVAVAAGLVDFAIGTDTGGSVRIPAAFCGILGFRPSHGAVSTVGLVPMAQSLDTAGWFARDTTILRKVGHVLLQLPYTDFKQPRRIIISDDCFRLSTVPKERSLDVAVKSIEKAFLRPAIVHMKLGDYMASNIPSLKAFKGEVENGKVEPENYALIALKNALRLLQRFEFKTNHEEWINNVKPDLGPGIADRVSAALQTTPEQISLCLKVRDEARMVLNELLANDGVLVMPTAPGPPPKLRTRETLLADFRENAFCLLSVAGMSGCCQVSLPAGKHDECPVALSLIARTGSDRFLLDTANTLYPLLQKEAESIASASSSISTVTYKPEAAEAAKEKGNIAFKNMDYKAAIDCYSEAIQFDGKNATYYSNRAAAHLAMYSFTQAEADCCKAIDLDRKNIKAHLRRGTAREFLGYYREADEDFKQALVLEPTNKTAGEAVKRLRKVLYE
eukprot:c28964_g1_i6 orf=348-2147(+)